MPPKAVVEDFDDDTEFDLPGFPSSSGGGIGGSGANNAAAQMAAMQEMMSKMGGGAGGAGGVAGIDPSLASFGATRPPPINSPEKEAEHKRWITLYPIYFDAKRHYKKGSRRVNYEKSSINPQSLVIARAVQKLGLLLAHEPYKTHPQDWENPGRVKVKLFDEDGKPTHSTITSKKSLLDAVAELIQPQTGGKPPSIQPRVKRSKKAAPDSKGEQGGEKPADKEVVRRDRRNPNPNPLRQRLKSMNLPPLSERLPPHSPALDNGLLNMNLGEAMGGSLEGLGPLGGMLGGMGLGGDDDDEEDEEDEEGKKKPALTPQQQALANLGRRQKKKVIRVGR
ncbi:signal recognition particle, SRP19 subunit [Violaceomyces palustris]|uniref:Signal recognition particle, SRP19 subunit n=1 Tax=Violaceomyces palustris TaxID=1673888 RepID=A0ACD0P8G8_9BASI|nr:signal recognition particle, SRP19 subunit [Violaceomyces palustris]